MNYPVKVGVVGLGQRGLQHLAALVRLQIEGLAQVTVLCDAFQANLEPAKLQSFVPDLDLQTAVRTQEFTDLLEPGTCDALFLAIPPNLHKDEVVTAAQAGLHLMVEKPMSLNMVQALQMEAAIAEAGVVACCGFQQRYDPRHEAVQAYVSQRKAVMATYAFHAALERHDAKHTDTQHLGGPASRVWAASRAWSGTTVVEGGIHLLDLWRYWFGEVEWVQAVYVPRAEEDIVDQADNPYAYSVQFGFERGAIGNLVLSRLRRAYNVMTEHRVFCTESQVSIEPDQVKAFHYAGPYPPSSTPTSDEVAQVLWAGPREEGTYPFAKAFVQAIGEQNPDRLRSSFRDAMGSLAGVLAANVSDEQEGRRVYIRDWIGANQMRLSPQSPRG